MSRRALTPYIVAGAVGIISGVYTFRPLLQEAAEQRKLEEELRATTQLQSPSDQPPAGTAAILPKPVSVPTPEALKQEDAGGKTGKAA
ncbi:hypothetical protein FIBSPDRAFT_947348 [Athelia psychrophila]|uniref:Uncharacterized protein n=1 Tax=Athelia psychrophila TaxID=1759441 RepID=A0A166S2R4_9AGAM|nr:hypothetical protein FIBSPDRAFT_947348 [Fibularhizoctonia sp. CBS 109695]